MSDLRELSLERLSVAAKGRDDVAPYVAAAREAGATEHQIARVLERLLRDAAPVHLLESDRRDVG